MNIGNFFLMTKDQLADLTEKIKTADLPATVTLERHGLELIATIKKWPGTSELQFVVQNSHGMLEIRLVEKRYSPLHAMGGIDKKLWPPLYDAVTDVGGKVFV